MRAWVLVLVAACDAGRQAPGTGHRFDLTRAEWTEELSAVARSLAITCAPEPIEQTALARCDTGELEMFGTRVAPTLYADHGKLAGYTVSFTVAQCTPQLAHTLASHYDETLDSKNTFYVIRRDDSLAYFQDCTLAVGGSAFQHYYVAKLLGEGFSNLGRAMSAH